MKIKFNYLVISILVFLVFVTNILLVQYGINWYSKLSLPYIAPRIWIDSMISGLIAILITVSIILFWNNIIRDFLFFIILSLFCIIGYLNFLLNYSFFYKHNIGHSVIYLAMLSVISITVFIFLWNKIRIASILLLPYIVWMIFKMFIYFKIWLLN